MNHLLRIGLFGLLLQLYTCHSTLSTQSTRSTIENEQNPISLKEENNIERQPNIVWIVAEDLSEYLPMFGDSTVATPALSRLAKEGICYDRFFSPAAVCAPARSAIALGMYPSRIGSNHMRTGPWFRSNLSQDMIDNYTKTQLPEGIHAYEAIPPSGAKMMSEYLREAGYYCSNNAKEDYQFVKTITAWDACDNNAHWRNRDREDQPFFSIFNLGITHESQIWARAKDSLWVDRDMEVNVPPYLPDTEVGRQDVRQMYSNIKQMDAQAGEIIAQLESDGLLDNTIIFWYSDHGGPLPRQKRLLYDSGIKVPLIIRHPDQRLAGSRNNEMTSFIDLAPTVLSIAGIRPSEDMDGSAFLGEYKRLEPAQYVFSAADRFDKVRDANRAVRDDRYKLIRYYMTNKSMFLPVAYREQMPIMQELHRLREAGELTQAQALWFRETKPEYEFFDTENDPHELNNLINDLSHTDKITELKQVLAAWQSRMNDPHMADESQYIASLWPNGVQPQVTAPEVSQKNQTLTVSSTTDGASLAYQIIGVDHPDTNRWMVYTAPIKFSSGVKLKIAGDRVGYIMSKVIEIEIE